MMFNKLFLINVLVLCNVVNGMEEEKRDPTDKKIVYPEIFGNFSLSSCSGAPACGTGMASVSGIWAYSNGADQCTGYSCGSYVSTGYQYQCVEFAQRYFNTLHGTQANWGANAIDMCARRPAGVSLTNSPKAGDLVVFNWAPYGHVAVITAFYGSTFDVVEQNSSPNGKNSYSTSGGVECYLTAGGGSSCPNGGYYCGNNGVSGSSNTLYYCSGKGGSQSTIGCGFTCAAYPEGYDDTCVGGTCQGVGLNGYYCGNDNIGGDANTLYLCQNGAPNGARHCMNGCAVQSAGYDDYCR